MTSSPTTSAPTNPNPNPPVPDVHLSAVTVWSILRTRDEKEREVFLFSLHDKLSCYIFLQLYGERFCWCREMMSIFFSREIRNIEQTSTEEAGRKSPCIKRRPPLLKREPFYIRRNASVYYPLAVHTHCWRRQTCILQWATARRGSPLYVSNTDRQIG